jgi:MinD superfamily P-loop ATPase
VAEPTPFGLNDLTLAAGMGEALGLPSGVVINKGGADDRIIEEFCASAVSLLLLQYLKTEKLRRVIHVATA